MGGDSSPDNANLFLLSYELQYILKHKLTNYAVCRALYDTHRYIDDITTLNDDGVFEKNIKNIYPNSLVLKPVNTDATKANVLDIDISIHNGRFTTALYDKRDSFDFPIVSLPCIKGNVASTMCYSVFKSQLIRYSRICSSYTAFISSSNALIHKLKLKSYSTRKLKQHFIKCVNKHDIKKKYKLGHLNATKIWLNAYNNTS